ncbi:MAG: hypothetical protein JW726_00505, partial [Anaerolineales bacterium]|nr:hypothetical protein [Anaerolineales bacterium]
MKAELPPENDLEAALDDALHTYPTLSPPPGFSDRVMVRVEATQGQRPIFSLSWLDYALSVLLLVMAAGTWLVWQILPPHVLAQVKLQILSLSLVYAQLA